jgi:type III restriction enzyme
MPVGELDTWFEPFELNLSSSNFPPVDDRLHIQELRTGAIAVMEAGIGTSREPRLEDYVVSGLIDFDEISYDDHADLLQDIATQVVNHLRTNFTDSRVEAVLIANQRTIVQSLFSQMAPHFREDASGGFETQVVAGFTPI